MGSSQRFFLVVNTSFRSLTFCHFNEVLLYFCTKIGANYKGNLIYFLTANLCNIFYETLNNCFTCHGDKRFCGGKGVWAHPLTFSCHWDNNLHRILLSRKNSIIYGCLPANDS